MNKEVYIFLQFYLSISLRQNNVCYRNFVKAKTIHYLACPRLSHGNGLISESGATCWRIFNQYHPLLSGKWGYESFSFNCPTLGEKMGTFRHVNWVMTRWGKKIKRYILWSSALAEGLRARSTIGIRRTK